MSELLRDRITVAASPGEIWAIIDDVDALSRVLPGVETIVAREPGVFVATLSVRIQFLTVRADVEARFTEAEPPTRARLHLEGRPHGLVGNFSTEIPFVLRETPGASAGASNEERVTEIEYGVEIALSGRLAAFGAPLLRDTFRRQVATLVTNLETELARRRSAAERGETR